MLAVLAALIGSFHGTGAGHGILASGPDAGNASGDDEHPEETLGRGSIGGSGHGDAEDEEDGGGHGARLAAQLVDDDAEEEHTDDHADEKGVAEARVDGVGQVIWVDGAEKKLDVAYDGGIAMVR